MREVTGGEHFHRVCNCGAADWLTDKEQRIRIATYAQYQVQIDLHLSPAIGDQRVDTIRVKHLEDFREKRLRAGLAPQSVNKLLTTPN